METNAQIKKTTGENKMKKYKFSYNLEKLIRIQLNDFYESGRYTYEEEKRSKRKWSNRIIQKEGFYQSWMYDHGKTLKVLPKDHTLKDGNVYENPEIVLHFENGHSRTIIFKTLAEAEEYRTKIKEKRKTVWINI